MFWTGAIFLDEVEEQPAETEQQAPRKLATKYLLQSTCIRNPSLRFSQIYENRNSDISVVRSFLGTYNWPCDCVYTEV
jgi:hypothetical protein